MQNITIIGTRHEKLGSCNSYELFTIIESLKPEVIFEELPPSYFDQYYTSKNKSNLESIAIEMYLNRFKAIQILVDSEDIPQETFFNDYNTIVKNIVESMTAESLNYSSIIETQIKNIENKGFAYLNSLDNIKANLQLNHIIEFFLKSSNNASLNTISQSWRKINETRENTMLNNIYHYCEMNEFERAIFTVGSAHLISLKEKIEIRKDLEKPRINWSILF